MLIRRFGGLNDARGISRNGGEIFVELWILRRQDASTSTKGTLGLGNMSDGLSGENLRSRVIGASARAT